MRKYALPAALAGAVIATAMALPNRADAMTISAPSSLLDAGATIEVAQPEQVRWCGSRDAGPATAITTIIAHGRTITPVCGTGRAAFKLRSCVVEVAAIAAIIDGFEGHGSCAIESVKELLRRLANAETRIQRGPLVEGLDVQVPSAAQS